MLGSLQVSMAQHFANSLNGNAIAERDSSGKSMPCSMDSHVLGNTTQVSDLLKVRVHLLVAGYR